MLRAPVSTDVGLVDVSLAGYSARDEFNQTAGDLTGKTAPVGGVWAEAGDVDGLMVETTGKTAQRTATSDTSDIGHAANIGSSITAQAVQVDVKATAFGNGPMMGVLLRFVDANNYAAAVIDGFATSDAGAGMVQKLSGGAYGIIEPRLLKTTFTAVINQWYTIRALVDSIGRWFIWVALQGQGLGNPVLQGSSTQFATGGTLATGKPGIFDYHGATGSTRSYDNFLAWVPPSDAVLYPNQSAQLGTDGIVREDSSGAAYGPVPHKVSDLPRLPPSGEEGRTVQVFLKGSRGDFDELPDTGIDNISARTFYRPSWLFVAES